MRLHEHATSPAITVDVEGSITRHDARAVLLATLTGLIDRGYTMILLNVAQVTYVDSVTLGALVQVYTSALRHGATLKLQNVTERMRQLLRITKLDTVIDVIESEDEGSRRV
jgi:anti-sigma B factor antagonist